MEFPSLSISDPAIPTPLSMPRASISQILRWVTPTRADRDFHSICLVILGWLVLLYNPAIGIIEHEVYETIVAREGCS